MKKIILSLILFALFFLCGMQANASTRKKTVDSGRIERLVNELCSDARKEASGSERESLRLPGIRIISDENLDLVSVGPMGLGLVRTLARSGAEGEDELAALAAFGGIKKIMILDYENCSEKLKTRFDNKIADALAGVSMLIEAKDDGEVMRIYGTETAGGSKINDIVMYAPEESALLCFFGSIDADDLGKLIEAGNKH